MVVALMPERDMRGPGCDARCQVLKAIIPGVFGRSELLLHDAEAHEEYGRGLPRPTTNGDRHTVITGRLAVNLSSLEVSRDGRPIALSKTELRLLCLLARHVGQVVPYGEITASVWGPEYLGPGAGRARQVTLNRLRAKLEADGGLIVTVPAIGTRLQAMPPGEPAPRAISWARPRLERWARDWDRCRGCSRTDRPHNGRGYCIDCHHGPRDEKTAARAAS